MSNGMYFVRECPTCGRHLYIRVEYLGKKVVCQHCHGKLEARDPATSGMGAFETSESLLRRADELLGNSASEVDGLRQPYPR
ncbi:MAG: hypothetical protein JXM70_18330 [Pirellulales bacterium]|nr:hypothetical protein [Pirellulales bacterium]